MPVDERGFFYAEPNPAREKEKREMLAMSEAEAATLSNPMRYQRMRYQREVEAHEYVIRVQNEARIRREAAERATSVKSIGVQSTKRKKEWVSLGYDKD